MNQSIFKIDLFNVTELLHVDNLYLHASRSCVYLNKLMITDDKRIYLFDDEINALVRFNNSVYQDVDLMSFNIHSIACVKINDLLFQLVNLITQEVIYESEFLHIISKQSGYVLFSAQDGMFVVDLTLEEVFVRKINKINAYSLSFSHFRDFLLCLDNEAEFMDDLFE